MRSVMVSTLPQHKDMGSTIEYIVQSTDNHVNESVCLRAQRPLLGLDWINLLTDNSRNRALSF